MEKRVKELILRGFPSIPVHLGNQDLLRENGFTSLMFVELILLLEKEFGIEVLDEEIGQDGSARLSGFPSTSSVNLMGGQFHLCL